jgi:hypothetical protein
MEIELKKKKISTNHIRDNANKLITVYVNLPVFQ